MTDLNKPLLGKWKILNEEGHGKHGVVYKVENIYDRSIAAAKIISLPNDEMLQYATEEYGDNYAMIDNFVNMVAENFGNEVESMRQLNNVPYVISLYDNQLHQTAKPSGNGIQVHGYDIIMVMEFATPVKTFFKDRPLLVRDVIDFASDIALGLNECSSRNIIHRDIKEDNLFIGINDRCGKLGDFGVASINETGLGSTMGMGTPYYMAPEVANTGGAGRERYSNTVDIYSLGIVLYKMLNGNRFPFAEEGVASLKKALDRRMKGEPVPYPRYAQNELGQIVLKCIEYNPANRFRNSMELYDALQNFKRRLTEQELDIVLPYRDKKTSPPPTPSRDPVSEDNSSSSEPEKKQPDILNSTMDILADLTGTVAVVFRGLLKAVSSKQRDEIEQQYKKRQRRNIIIFSSVMIAALIAVLVMLYPKTATFYSDFSDNGRIHVKYLFLPDRQFEDVAASYLTVDGNWLYYSNPEEDHSLYRLSIWYGEPELLCQDDCEYDVIIGDYIYFTNYDEGEYLYRIKKDGVGGKQLVLQYACRDLKRNGNNLMFVLADSGELKELDTTTIQ